MRYNLVRTLFVFITFCPFVNAVAQSTAPGDFLNVKSYGATGNGSSDDYGAITAAMTDAANYNATVYFPPGTYIISQTLRPPASITLKGCGWRAAVIKGSPTFINTGDANNGNALIGIVGPAAMIKIQDLGFIANGPYLRGVKMLSTSDNLVERCWFAADFAWGCFIGSQSRSCRVDNIVSNGTTTSHNVEINDSSFCEVSNSHLIGAVNNNVEIYLVTSGECVGNRVVNNRLEAAAGSGIVVVGDQNTVISGNIVANSGLPGFRAQSASYLATNDQSVGGTLVGNTFVNNGGSTQHGVFLDVGSKAWTVKGNTVTRSGNCGIYVSGTAQSVEGNTVRQSGRHGIYVRTNGHTIANNVSIDNSTGGAGNADGIRVEASQCLLLGNRCTDTRATKLQAFGLGIIGGAGHIITGNNAAGNLSVAIYDTSSGSTKANNITQ